MFKILKEYPFWSPTFEGVQLEKVKKYQRVNHLPGNGALTYKVRILMIY